MSLFIKKENEEYYVNIIDKIEIKEGEYKEFYENGSIKVECNYNNNKLHGKYILYNYDKTINKISNYNNDVLEGEEIEYYNHFNKRNMRKSNYENGKLHGKSKLYNGDNKLEWIIIYDNGNIKSPYKKHSKCIIS